MIKTLNKLRIKGNFLSLIKSIYKKPTANITLNVWHSKLSHYNQVQGQDVPSHHFFSTSNWKVLVNAVRQEKKKGIQIWEGRNNTVHR